MLRHPEPRNAQQCEDQSDLKKGEQLLLLNEKNDLTLSIKLFVMILKAFDVLQIH